MTLARSEKMTGLLDELGLAPAGTLDDVDEAAVARALVRAIDAGAGERHRLASVRDRLAARAAENLRLWLPEAQDALAR